EVTAVLCGNDDIALGAMRAMHEAGRPVPTEVSIIGFDDVPMARFYTPALTTVRQDFKTLGRACFAKLLSFLNPAAVGQQLSHPEAQLVIRESAGPPPRLPGALRGPPRKHMPVRAGTAASVRPGRAEEKTYR
ncbi:MAG TPA: substrate-binding domain-containing protein, partial [Acidimicrobiales bacterium]|nr:substrate-binding domain-containing protein [Acidimicrobiales bacterium]